MPSAIARFIDDTYDRVHAGDPKVFAECFTPDFTYTGPEAKMMSADGSLHGENALRAMYSFEHGDKGSWSSVTRENIIEIESGDYFLRVMKWVAKHPYESYLGFDNLPPDMEVTNHIFIVYTFRDGKICNEFFAYDTLGYFTDIAQGDMQKAATALAKFTPMMSAGKGTVKDGEVQFPPFPEKT